MRPSLRVPVALSLLVVGCGPGSGDTMASGHAQPGNGDAHTTIGQHARPFAARGQNFVAHLPSSGLHLELSTRGAQITANDGTSSLQLRFDHWGRDAQNVVGDVAAIQGDCTTATLPNGACVRRIERHHDGVVEWWVAKPTGAQQGWTVEQRPSGQGPLSFTLSTDASATPTGLQDAQGRAWSVGEVRAWDANDTALPASLTLTNGEVVVTVDDTDAAYPILVDPFFATPAWSVDAVYEPFGAKLSPLGDVNGDGYEDLISCTPDFDPAYNGHAWIVYGSAAGLDTDAPLELWAPHDHEQYARDCVGLGDINDDGYDDVAITRRVDADSPYVLDVHLGSPLGIDPTPSQSLQDRSTRWPGADIDGDGFLDLISERIGFNAFTVYRGSATGFTDESLGGAGGTAVDRFLTDAAVADVNGDGFDDIVVGAPNQKLISGGTYEFVGRVSVYTGSANGLSSTATTLYGQLIDRSFFGTSIASLGDVNGDGFDDVAVGAPGVNYTPNPGQVYLFSGSNQGLDPNNVVILSGATPDDEFGQLVRNAGDLDANGHNDLLVLTSGYPWTADVYFGTSNGIVATALDTIEFYRYGNFDGDVYPMNTDADAFGELVAGHTRGSFDKRYGYLEVFQGSASGVDDITTTYAPPYPIIKADRYPAPAGDLDGDGYPDILVREYEDGRSNNIHIFRGGPDGPSTTPWATINQYGGGDDFAAFPVGDFDGDGVDDLAFGADYGTSSSLFIYGLDAGGESTMLVQLDYLTDPFGPSPAQPRDACALGDTNGDGHPDLAIGGSSQTPFIHVYQTNGTDLGDPVFEFDDYGYRVKCLDVNGDGRTDLVTADETTSSNRGKVFVFFNQTDGTFPATPDVTLTGGSSSAKLGQYIDGGDVDGDGFDDLVITSSDGTHGRVTVYFGAPTGLRLIPLTWDATSALSTLLFARVLGDTDGDGFADIAVSTLGGSLIWQGGASGPVLNTDIAYTKPVYPAGDPNDDGFDDLFVWQQPMPPELYLGFGTDSDGDGSPDSADCEPNNPDVYPGAPDICDGIDTNCNDVLDDEAPIWFADLDGDLYGDPEAPIAACTQPADTVSNDQDCDDTRTDIAPGETELCDGVDNNCDDRIDEAGAIGENTYYADTDEDGFGDPATTVQACAAPDGYVSDLTDCDDASASTHPGAEETCDDIDHDCGDGPHNDAVDAPTWYPDTDEDGFGDPRFAIVACSPPNDTFTTTAEDCDDTNFDVKPTADEVCDGSVDEDCDTVVDGPNAIDATTWYADADDDGYGDPAASVQGCAQPTGYVSNLDDCNDTSDLAKPGGIERCDGLDNDCNGTEDDDAIDASTWYTDADGDGFGTTDTIQACSQPANTSLRDDDCDDTRQDAFPGAPERCNGSDDDCNGTADDGVPTSTWFLDSDDDGFGDPSTGVDACAPVDGHVADGTDCDDTSNATYPGATELWYDGIDQACDGGSDYDADGDGQNSDAHGGDDCDDADADVFLGAPDVPYDGQITNCANTDDFDADADGHRSETHGGDDCDDTTSAVNPGAREIWYDGTDQNCDGNDLDQDEDGFAASSEGGDDCNDLNADIRPSATEIWYDGTDQNCDGNDLDQDNDGVPSPEDCDDTNATITDCPEDTDSVGPDDKPPGCGSGCQTGTAGGSSMALWWLMAAGLWRRRQPAA